MPLQDRMPALRPGDALVSLDLERARIEQELQHTPDERVPLPVAAAGAMHLVCRNTHDLIARSAYDDALNIAAVAISRLVPVFALTDPRQVEEVEVLAIDVNRERFANGATELRRMDGRKITRLFIRRSDMLSALAFIRRTGNLFAL